MLIPVVDSQELLYYLIDDSIIWTTFILLDIEEIVKFLTTYKHKYFLPIWKKNHISITMSILDDIEIFLSFTKWCVHWRNTLATHVTSYFKYELIA